MKKLAIFLILTFSIALYGMGYPAINKEYKSSFENAMPPVEDTVLPPKKDTTDIKFKNKKIRITEDEKGTDIQVKDQDEKEWDFDDEDWEHDWDNDDPRFDFDFGEDDGFDLHWAGFEIGLNNYLNGDQSLNLSSENEFMDLNTGKSWNVNINILEYDVNLVANRLGLGTGLGFEFNDYRFDNRLPVIKGDNGILVDSSYAGSDFHVEKAKLTTTYITVPLILEYQVDVGGDNEFFIGAGIIGGIKIGSHTKVKFDRNGDTKKDKNRSDFYLSPYRYGYTARAGYGFLKLFANYYDTSLFESGKGPKLHPFTVGFMLSF